MSLRNTEIEALRAIAILFALGAHINGFLFPSGTSLYSFIDQYLFFGVGVDLFFCISGYVVASSLLPRLDSAKNPPVAAKTIIAFWVRRIFRLLPSAWFWVAVTLAASYWFNTFVSFRTPEENWESIVPIITFRANLIFPHGLGAGPNIIHWSLALEEQFYAVFPIACFFVRGNLRVLALVAGIIWQFSIVRVGGSPDWFLRIEAMLWGVLIYELNKRGLADFLRDQLGFLSGNAVARYSLILAGLCIAAALPSAALLHIPHTYGWVAIIMAALVLLASLQNGSIAPNVSPLILWVASRSYAIYLAHIPVFRFLNECIALSPLAKGAGFWPFQIFVFIVAIILVSAVAEFSYRCIETPLRRKGVDMSSKMVEADLTPRARQAA